MQEKEQHEVPESPTGQQRCSQVKLDKIKESIIERKYKSWSKPVRTNTMCCDSSSQKRSGVNSVPAT